MTEKYNKKFINLKTWDGGPLRTSSLFSCIITASRNTGKSFLLCHLIKKFDFNKVYDKILIFANSSEVLETYKEHVKGNFFFNEYKADIIDRIYKINNYLSGLNKQLKILIILDDTTDQKYNMQLIKLYCTSRHFNISVIYLIQKINLLNTALRENSDIIIIGRTKGAQEKNTIIKNILSGSIDADELPEGQNESLYFNKLLKCNTVNFGFIVYDTTNKQSAEFIDTVYKYRAS